MWFCLHLTDDDTPPLDDVPRLECLYFFSASCALMCDQRVCDDYFDDECAFRWHLTDDDTLLNWTTCSASSTPISFLLGVLCCVIDECVTTVSTTSLPSPDGRRHPSQLDDVPCLECPYFFSAWSALLCDQRVCDDYFDDECAFT